MKRPRCAVVLKVKVAPASPPQVLTSVGEGLDVGQETCETMEIFDRCYIYIYM